nr:MAG TPA: ATPase [Caudoviricetes sp.]
MSSKDWYLVLCVLGTCICVLLQYKLYKYLKYLWKKEK